MATRFPERPSNISVIEACTLFNAVDSETRERLAGLGHMAYAERGETIWDAGAPSEFCAVVGVGFIKMAKTSPRGQDAAMELLGPGQCLGLLVAIEGKPYPLSAIAVTNTWYLKVPTRGLMAVYTESPAFKDRIIRGIGPRLRQAHEMMARLTSSRVEERLAAVLFILADSYGAETKNGVELQVPLTRSDLAEMAGTTTESTIRALSRWQKEGAISTSHQRITLRSPERLLEFMQR
ncbi:MAG TPA: Crp/Fnr family transcriptional regulator [Fimbriimonadaceae bacterium]|nr:Crp/Fnr family transcriptional regulator [Fimbriimonadaceae bacterium]